MHLKDVIISNDGFRIPIRQHLLLNIAWNTITFSIASFLKDGRLFLQDRSLGIGAKVPPWTISLLSLCSQPHSRNEVVAKMSSRGGQLFDQFVEIGVLIPVQEEKKEQMFRNFASIPVHRRMLLDEIRLNTYREALSSVITPKSIVIDAGSGTGALAVYAALAGAQKVYAVEQSELADQIMCVAQDSGVAEKIEVIQSDFAQLELREKADILVTETFGAWALAEGAAADLKKCAYTNLKEDGLLLPAEISFWIAPLDEIPQEMLHPFRAREDGLNLQSFLQQARTRSANLCIQDHGSPQKIQTLSLLENRIQGSFTLQNPCKALLLWFDLHFPNSITLSTAPNQPATHWKQTVIAADLPAGEHRIAGEPSSDDPRGYTLFVRDIEYRIR
mgnify:CR=1 FL=1